MASLVTDPRQASEPISSTPLRGLVDLPHFIREIAQYDNEFVIYDDGYRGWTFRYSEIGRLAGVFAARLRASGVTKGASVMIWSESRPGWIVAMWGWIEQEVQPRLVLLGDRVPVMTSSDRVPAWRLSEIEQTTEEAQLEAVPLSSDDVAEIVFTSGTIAVQKIAGWEKLKALMLAVEYPAAVSLVEGEPCETPAACTSPRSYACATEVMSTNALAAAAHEGISAFREKRPACWKGR